MSIHPSSIVSDSANIHPSVHIGPFCIIGDNVEIDSGSSILSHSVVKGPTKIGNLLQIENHLQQKIMEVVLQYFETKHNL